MNAAVIVFVLIALAVGGLIGWLIGSRDGAAARQTVDKSAAAARRGGEGTRFQPLGRRTSSLLSRPAGGAREIVRAADRSAQGSQGEPFGAIPRDRQQVARRRAQDLSRAGRREVHAKAVTPVELLLQDLSGEAADDRKGARRPLCGLREAVELVRTGQGQVRDETRSLVNALRASPKARGRWGEQSLKNVLEQAGSKRIRRFPDGSVGRGRGRDGCARTSWCGCRAGESW